jgi:Dolichyl-phosphate-mannose-protein mannosyltransferase
VAHAAERAEVVPAETAPVSAAARRSDRADRALAIATSAVVAVGILLRIRQWAFARSFWLDEVQLLDAVTGRSYGGLLLPLNQNQAAPPGWLWAQHTVQLVFGSSERSLRLLPLLFGCGAVVLAAALARRVLGSAGALTATVLVACSPLLVYYSNEFKQYSSDLFWTLLLVLGVVLLGRAASPRRYLAWGAVAAVSAWFSHASLLAAGGGLVVLAVPGLPALRRRDWRPLAGPAAAAILWLLSVGVEYAVALRRVSTNEVLLNYWRAGFPAQPPTPVRTVLWIGPALRNLLDRPFALGAGGLVLVLLLTGVAVLANRRPLALAALLLPPVVTVAAAIAGAYPVADRLVLFWVPLVLLVLASPVDLWADARLSRPVALTAAGLALLGLAVVAGPNVRTAAEQVASPGQVEETRPVVAYVAAHRRTGDAVLVDPGGEQTVELYARRIGLRADRVRLALPSRNCQVGAVEAALTRSASRVWVVFGHQFTFVPADARERFRAHFATIGAHVDRVVEPGVEADLYDLRQPPDDPARTDHRLTLRGAQCLLVLPGLPATFS